MSVVPRSSDVFVEQKLASRSVHGGTLLDRLFSKGLRKGYFIIMLLLKIRNVSERTRTAVVLVSSVFARQTRS